MLRNCYNQIESTSIIQGWNEKVFLLIIIISPLNKFFFFLIGLFPFIFLQNWFKNFLSFDKRKEKKRKSSTDLIMLKFVSNDVQRKYLLILEIKWVLWLEQNISNYNTNENQIGHTFLLWIKILGSVLSNFVMFILHNSESH